MTDPRRLFSLKPVVTAWAFIPVAWAGAWPAILLGAGALTGLILAREIVVVARVGLASLIWVAASGSIWRVAMAGDGVRGAALAPGRLELRLLGGAALTLVFFFVMALLAFTLWLAFAYAAAAAGPGFVADDIASWRRSVDSRGHALMAVVSCLCFASLAWAAVRLYLSAPATAYLGRVQVLASWPLTRGRALYIVAAGLVAMAAPGAVTWGLLIWSEHVHRGLARDLDGLLLALLAIGLWLPLTVGLMRYFYLDAHPPEPRPHAP